MLPSEIDVSVASPLVDAADEIRLIVENSEDRRIRLLELTAELQAAATLGKLGFTYDALHHYQRCLDRSAAMLRLDREVAAPLEARFRAGVAMAEIYAESSEHTKHLTSLEFAYDGLLEARRRNLNTDHYDSSAPEFFWHMVEAAVHQYYVVSGSESALEENAFYADRVYFFDKFADRREILKDQQDYRKRYPHRIHEVREIVKLSASESDGFQARFAIVYWLADPTKKNTITIPEPDGKLAQNIKFEFDESNRLKIVSIAADDNQ